MAFNSYEMIFDGISCNKFGLMLYDIGSFRQNENINITSAGKPITDSISRRVSSILYGTEKNIPLTFNLVLVVSPDRIESSQYLDRYELQKITGWLTGHDSWKWLKIIQPDLETIRYKCLITEITEITIVGQPWALNCVVTCDSPYAYMNPNQFEYTIGENPTNILFRNRSSFNGTYYPKIEIILGISKNIEIKNVSNKNSIFKFTNIPSGVTSISIDNDKQIISNNLKINLYPYFNFGWLGFVRGDNQLVVTGDCTLNFICEFPVNVGA